MVKTKNNHLLNPSMVSPFCPIHAEYVYDHGGIITTSQGEASGPLGLRWSFSLPNNSNMISPSKLVRPTFLGFSWFFYVQYLAILISFLIEAVFDDVFNQLSLKWLRSLKNNLQQHSENGTNPLTKKNWLLMVFALTNDPNTNDMDISKPFWFPHQPNIHDYTWLYTCVKMGRCLPGSETKIKLYAPCFGSTERLSSSEECWSLAFAFLCKTSWICSWLFIREKRK